MSDTLDENSESEETVSDIRSVAEAAYDSAMTDAGGGEDESNQPQDSTPVASPSSERTPSAGVVSPADNDIPAPYGWAAEKADIWKGLNRDQKEYIYGRWVESDRYVKKKAQEYTERAKVYESLDNVIKPELDELTLQGTTVDQIVGQALALRRLIKQDKQAAAQYFLQELGLHPSQLGQGPQRPQVDPQILQIRQELDGWKQAQAQARQEQIDQMMQDTAHEVNTIAAERDPAGRLKFGLADRLQDDMAKLIPLIRMEQQFRSAPTRTIFQEAYHRAALYNPDTRDIYQRQLQNSQLAGQQSNVERLKTAAVSVNGSPTSVGKTPQKRYSSVRAAAEAAYDEHSE